MRCEPQKACLHIGRQRRNLCGDGLIENFDPPGHEATLSHF
jgi:hypothetical protein